MPVEGELELRAEHRTAFEKINRDSLIPDIYRLCNVDLLIIYICIPVGSNIVRDSNSFKWQALISVTNTD